MNDDDFQIETRLEDRFRAMFAERSLDVPVATAPYHAVRQRIRLARRKRRQRLGGVGAALAVVAVGVGAWAVSGGPESVAPPAAPVTTSDSSAGPKPSVPARYFYDDGKTELPAGPLRDAAEAYAKAHYRVDLAGLTVVTTFDRAMQGAAEAAQSPNDIGFAALDPKTGYVKALRGPWDRPVEIADTMKPIVLAAAFEIGHYTPETTEPVSADKHPLFWREGDKEPMTYIDAETKRVRNWPPEHSGGTFTGDPYWTLAKATADAVNYPFARLALASDVGLTKVRAEAVALGIPDGAPDLGVNPSLALGVTEASPLTMAGVYGVFADGGVRHDPVMVSAVDDAKGTVLWRPDTTGRRVLSQSTASEITTVLTGVLTVGTASGRPETKALGLRGMAGMPGTSDYEHAVWFDGYSPDLATSIALSRVDAQGKPLKLVSPDGMTLFGSTVVAPMWAQFAGTIDR